MLHIYNKQYQEIQDLVCLGNVRKLLIQVYNPDPIDITSSKLKFFYGKLYEGGFLQSHLVFCLVDLLSKSNDQPIGMGVRLKSQCFQFRAQF
jgi:hypothetical protein